MLCWTINLIGASMSNATLTLASTARSTELPAPETEAQPEWLRWSRARPGVSATIEVNGAALHYQSWSLEHDERPALLLIHGFRAHAGWWNVVAPCFADDYRVVAMDLAGMGDSAHRQSYTPAGFAADINGLIEALGLGPVTAVGHSYGGARLLHACAERPELYRHLVVVDSFIRFAGEATPVLPSRPLGNRVYADFEQACARYRLMPEQPGVLPALLRQVAMQALKKVDGGWRWKFDPAMAPAGEPEAAAELWLPRVTPPVDVIYGEHSRVVSAERAARTVAHLPRARGPLMIPGSHHHIMLDQPVALVTMLRSLLAPERAAQ
jgi:pimeloyl-ACP methyl ester carboxylesterase